MINEMSNLVTDLCEFVCEYSASIAARIALNKFHIRMVAPQYEYADGCRDTVCDKMRLGTIHSEKVDFQLLATQIFVCVLILCFFFLANFIKCVYVFMVYEWRRGRKGGQRARE